MMIKRPFLLLSLFILLTTNAWAAKTCPTPSSYPEVTVTSKPEAITKYLTNRFADSGFTVKSTSPSDIVFEGPEQSAVFGGGHGHLIYKINFVPLDTGTRAIFRAFKTVYNINILSSNYQNFDSEITHKNCQSYQQLMDELKYIQDIKND